MTINNKIIFGLSICLVLNLHVKLKFIYFSNCDISWFTNLKNQLI